MTIMETEIRKAEDGGKGRYVLPMPGGEEAYLTYVRSSPDHILIDYSFVPPSARGKGVGARLVAHAVEDARANGMRITPVCGYVAAEFRRHREWADVLAA
ncbi:GNAT family N-acetyltransferase [Aquamicrobium terrae]|uniref:GNAT family acetyltransferase n=1 Tax=Aquamicrobium terrae TaxID=1324945 RepID=A0ABV2N2T4_9HYPH